LDEVRRRREGTVEVGRGLVERKRRTEGEVPGAL